MKQTLYGTVSALALMLAAHGAAVAGDSNLANASTDVSITNDNASGIFSGVTNTINDNAFQDATGAFQVQQNNSVNSAASQNMAIGALNDRDDSTDVALATSTLTASNNSVKNSTVLGFNNIFNNAFSSASGAFQVQQANSIQSGDAQNMAIGAQVTGSRGRPNGFATASTEITVNSPVNVTNVSVIGFNDIFNDAFQNASGAFQVQQDNSINSLVSQNMAIGAQSVENEDPAATAETSITWNSRVFSLADGVFVGDSNFTGNNAFQNAAGAFEVQQNNSASSQTSQNMAIGVQTVAASADPSASASSEISVVGLATEFATIGEINIFSDTNTITDNAFQNATGAFQVQQNNSIMSQTAQNMAIGAQTTRTHAGSSADATSTFFVFDNEVAASSVDGNNLVSGNAFQNATGAFQVQQNNAINSQTTQNMAIGSQSIPSDDPLAVAISDASVNFQFANFFGAVAVDSDNTIANNAFENATGAFQVQQNNSIQSATGQNMAIAALNASADAASFAIATSSLFVVDTTNGQVFSENLITDNAFANAAGAFQVQQSNSVNSSVQQNMAIAALDTSGGSFGAHATLADAELSNSVANVVATGSFVSSTNTINHNAFSNAAGAFQVQQNNSINSSVVQNMSIAAAAVNAR
jgi:hypothetical protein